MCVLAAWQRAAVAVKLKICGLLLGGKQQQQQEKQEKTATTTTTTALQDIIGRAKAQTQSKFFEEFLIKMQAATATSTAATAAADVNVNVSGSVSCSHC